MRRLFPVLFGLFLTVKAVKFIDQLSNQAVEVLHGSQQIGTVRQCLCQEMSDCYDDGKREALDCFEPCWKQLDAMTFRCAPTIEKAEKVRVHKYDYVEMVNKVEDVIEKQINKFLQSVTSHVVRGLISAGAKLGQCVKHCFVEKNRGGFCFDKKGCEPNISDRNAKSAIHQCAKQINWKNEIGELCKCASKSGVSGIADYCGMLNVIG